MIKEILLDVDGVLGDFVQASLDAHGRPEKHDDIKNWDYYQQWGMTDKEFWSKIDGHEFWLDIKLYPWADEFYKELCKVARVTIATSPCNDDFCSAGKHMWLRKHFGLKPKDSFIGGRKELFSQEGHVLIDDSTDNIIKFTDVNKDRYGTGIIFPQPWNEGKGNWETVLEKVWKLAYGD